jgi:hypothetical protein
MSCDWIRFHQAPATLSRDIGDEILVTRAWSDRVEGLPGTASIVWRRLASPVTLPELLDDVSRAYEVETSVIADDVKTLLDDLMKKHLVEELVSHQ